MGAGESKGQHSTEDGEDVLDYYHLLEVDENATADEIKVGVALTRAYSDCKCASIAFIQKIGTHPSPRQEPQRCRGCYETLRIHATSI